MTQPSTIIERHRAVFADLDGVVYRGPGAVPGAAHTFTVARELSIPVVFVTNNASRTPHAVADQLTALGIDATPEEVLTAAQAGVAMMSAAIPAGSRVYVVGGEGLRTAVSEAGFAMVAGAADDPRAVIQGFAPDVSWRDMAEASYAIAGGADFFATNLDRTIPNERGTAPGNGSLVAAVSAATGVYPPGAGKPQAAMFHAAAARAGETDAVMIGDRLDTDIAGANGAGYATLAVLTGVATPASITAALGHERPTYVATDLTALIEPYEDPRLDDGWFVVADVAARVHAHVLELKCSNNADKGLITRVATAAVWPAIDAGQSVSLEALNAYE